MPQRSQGIKTSNFNSLSKLDESSGTGESQHTFLKYKLKGLGTYSPGLDIHFMKVRTFSSWMVNQKESIRKQWDNSKGPSNWKGTSFAC